MKLTKAEKRAHLDKLIKKYPDKKFLKEIRKSYE
jgi:hypothetical protein